MRADLSLLCFLTTVHAIQLPFRLPFFGQKPSIQEPEHEGQRYRIAIIGGGSGGTSAAFWLSKGQERLGTELDVELFEGESRLGGRSTVIYPYDNEGLEPVELGASIFVDANKILHRAVKEFNLQLKNLGDSESEISIWDGEKFVITMGGGGTLSGWWDTIRIIWRYGYRSATSAKWLVQHAMETFLSVYQSITQWSSIEELAEALGFMHLTNQTGRQYFEAHGVGRLFVDEMVEAATRVNYGQNIDEIHALESMVSMAGTGAASVKGGNYQIFEQMMAASGYKVNLNTTVTGLRRRPDGRWVLSTADSIQIFDSVIVAAPLNKANLDLLPLVSSAPVEYVHLHVTILTTTSANPNTAYFSLKESSKAPTTILTTSYGARTGGKEPEFNTLSYIGPLKGQGEWVVKLFSKSELSDEWLEGVFGNVRWVHRKEWDAYPKLPPTTSFPPMKLEKDLWYINAIEPLISTMETSALGARGVVDELLRGVFEKGLCPSTPTPEQLANPDFVWGWDC